MYVCVCVHVHAQRPEANIESSSVAFPLHFPEKSLTWNLPIQLAWLACEAQGYLISPSPSAGATGTYQPCLAFDVGCGKLNSGTPACVVSALLTESTSALAAVLRSDLWGHGTGRNGQEDCVNHNLASILPFCFLTHKFAFRCSGLSPLDGSVFSSSQRSREILFVVPTLASWWGFASWKSTVIH